MRLPDDQYFGYLIHGLKENICGKVRSIRALGPPSHSQIMNLARVIKSEL